LLCSGTTEFCLSVLTESWLSAYIALDFKTYATRVVLKGDACAMAELRVPASQRKQKAKPAALSTDTETLNFKVTTAFKKEFKMYAVSQGMTMVELLKDGFELSKRKRNQ
jgi:hypothetical protein